MSKDVKHPGYRRHSMFPKTLSQCIEPITRPVFKKQGLAGTKIVSEWESIVGKKLADHCIAEKLSFPANKKTDGTLSIAVENGFATELQHLQPVIIDRIAIYFGYKAVTRIAITHSYTVELKKESPVIRQNTLPAECCEIVEEIEDSELRAALTNIAKTLSGL
ncbi:MAG: DUF721 domain-containing protein [Rickettsiales bacterium]